MKFALATLIPGKQDVRKMNASENQFSLTRAAPSTSGRATNQILIINRLENIMNKNTRTWVQLVWLLSVSLVFVKPATATSGPCAPHDWSYTTTAVVISNPNVSGGQADKPGAAGGNGGRIIVKTGVPVDTGNGSDGPLTQDVTLYSGTYNYTYIAFSITISIDGDVTIKCPSDFRANVRGVFHPDQPPPRVRIYVGHPEVFYHWIYMADMTAHQVFNSDGSGMHGGIFEFYTSEAGDLWSSLIAKGGYPGERGKGGNGGDITLVANGGMVVSQGMSANGAFGGYFFPGYYLGGVGGDGKVGGEGGRIFDSGLGFAHDGTVTLSANGGAGGSAYWGNGSGGGCRGGNGGSGGAIVISAPLCSSNLYTVSATGGNGGAGIGGDAGLPGGDGGSGGAPGVLVGITGTNTPGNGGNGGGGGSGAAGTDADWPPTRPGGPGGDGGMGGNGGDSGGTGATPGTGGPGGSGGAGGDGVPDGPPGQDGPRGEDGIIGNPAPKKPLSDSTSPYTYVLCAGTRDWDPNWTGPIILTNAAGVVIAVSNMVPGMSGDIGAERVRDAFRRLPNIPLRDELVQMNTSSPGNSDMLIRAINEATNWLRPGDNFIFYINCHAGPNPDTTSDADLVLGLSRAGGTSDSPWSELLTDDRLSSLFFGGVWDSVNKLFIMDCCYAYGFWYSNRGLEYDPDLVNRPKSAILAACSSTTGSNYKYDPNGAHFYEWGFMGRCLRDALNSLTNARAISFAQLAEATKAQWPLNSFIYDSYLQDLSTNYAILATNVWAPVWTNTSDFVMNLILVTNWLHLSLSSAHPLTSNGLDLSLDASPGLNCRIEVSTNLVSWTTLTNFVSTNATMYFRDTAATNHGRRFYRAVTP